MDQHSKTLVYAYFDENLNQCANYDLIIRPLVNISNEELLPDDDKRVHKQSVLLFSDPMPPMNFKVQVKSIQGVNMELSPPKYPP